MGEGVSLVSEFGDKGYLSCYDGMIGLSGIMVIYPEITSCYRSLDKMKSMSESDPGLDRAGASLLD